MFLLNLLKLLLIIYFCFYILLIIKDEKKIIVYFDNLYIVLIFNLIFITFFFTFLGFGPIINFFSFLLYVCPFFWFFSFFYSLKIIFISNVDFNFRSLSIIFLDLIRNISRVFRLTIRLRVNFLIGKTLIEYINLIENTKLYLILNLFFVLLELVIIFFQCFIFSYFISSFLSFN